jgi:hypothetical protein
MTPSDIAERHNLTPEQVESVGELPGVGQGGQTSHKIIQFFTPSKTSTPEEFADKVARTNDMMAELGLPVADRMTRDNSPQEIKTANDAIRLAVAKEQGFERSSQMSPSDWLNWLDNHADKLEQDTVATLLSAIGHQVEHNESKVEPFIKDPALTAALEKLDQSYTIERITDLQNVPNKDLRDKIYQLGYQYGLKQTAIQRAYQAARKEFLDTLQESPIVGSPARTSEDDTAESQAQETASGRGQKEELNNDDALFAKSKLFEPAPPTGTPAFKKWFGDSVVKNDDGSPTVLYHGTTHDFSSFDTERGNIENHFGKAIYLTDSPTDLEANYAGEGPDSTQRIEREAERILNEKDRDYNDRAMRTARRLAKSQIAGRSQGVSMPLYAKIEHPAYIGVDGKKTWIESPFENTPEPDTEEYYEWETTVGSQDHPITRAIHNAASEYDGIDANEVAANLDEAIQYTFESVTADQIDDALRKDESLYDAYDDKGGLANNDFIKEVFKNLGYDGIIMDADKAFGSQRAMGKSMQMDEDTKHYIVFNPTHVKSVFNRGTFDPNNKDILFTQQHDLFGNVFEDAPLEQGSLFSMGDRTEADTGLDPSTAKYVKSLVKSPNKQIAKIATTILDQNPTESGKPILSDAADALDIYSRAVQTKTPVADMLKQGSIGNSIQLSSRAQTFAKAMEAGTFPALINQELAKARMDQPLFAKANISPLGFFSQVEQTLLDKMPKRASADQVRGILKDTKQEEREWLDLDTFLKDNPNPTKDEVLDYVKANNADVREVVKGALSDEEISRVNALEVKALAAEERNDHTEAARLRKMVTTIGGNGYGPTKFSEYVLPGGENYRELLLTMPARRMSFEDWAKKEDYDLSKPEEMSKARRGYDRVANRSVPGALDNAYKSRHFAEPNILAHVRFDDRDNGDTLHIAEIQSDWHQAGRDKGYKGQYSVGEQVPVAGSRPATILDAKPDAEGKVLVRFADGTEGRTPGRYIDDAKLPNAPFKKSWYELAFKRVLRYAAENGYKRITWDTGKTQIDRYEEELRKNVDEIHYEKNDDGTWNLSAVKSGKDVLNKEDLSDDEFKELVGKDIFTKANDGVGEPLKDAPYRDWMVLKGDNLSIGGEGMIGFYNKMLPTSVNKLVKKFGSKVEETQLSSFDYPRIVETGSDTHPYKVLDINKGQEVSTTFTNKYAADKYLHDMRQSKPPIEKPPIFSVKITPEMRESVLDQGQPLFAKGEEETAGRLLQRYAPLNMSQVAGYAKSSMVPNRNIIRVNAAGITLFNQMFHFLGWGDKFTGVAIQNGRPETLVKHLETAAQNAQKEGDTLRKVRLESLATNLEKATGKDGRVAITFYDPKIPAFSTYNEQEEARHLGDMRMEDKLNERGQTHFDDAAPFEDDPDYEKALDAIREQGYPEAVLHREFLAKINRGDASEHLDLPWNTIDKFRSMHDSQLESLGVTPDEYREVYQDSTRYEQRSQKADTGLTKGAQPGGSGSGSDSARGPTEIRPRSRNGGEPLTSRAENRPDSTGLRQGEVSGSGEAGTRQIDTPQFKKWFGNSKVVDKNGNPLVVKHGTTSGDVNFKERERGIFFTDNDTVSNEYAQPTFFRGGKAGAVVPAYLSIQNPLVIDALGKRNDNIPVPWSEWNPKVFGNLPKTAVSIEDAFKYAIEHGHDGLIVKNVVDTANPTDKAKSNVYAVKSPSQIKSAIGNNGDFNPENDDIAFAKNTLVRKALDTVDKGLANTDFSSPMRAIEDVVNRGMRQLYDADEDAYEQVLKLAGTQARATIEALKTGRRDPSFVDALQKRNLDDVRVTLEVAGLAVPVTKGAPVPATVMGKPSKLLRIGDKPYAVPKWLATELDNVLSSPKDPNIVQKFVDKLDTYGMAGPLDLFYHGTNVIATVISNTPYAGTDIISKTIGNTPATKWLTSLVNIWRTNPESVVRDNPKMLEEMAEAGVIPPEYGRATYSSKHAGTGVSGKVKASLSPILSGPKGLDIRTRILMWQIGKEMNPSATPTEMNEFVNQLGIYDKALQSQAVKFLTGSRVGRFAVAGTTMSKNGVLAWLNKSPMPTENMPWGTRSWFRAQQQFSAGPIGLAVILWVGLSLLYRGMFPWKDPKSQFLRIPLNEKDRKSPLIRKIYGDTGDVSVNLGFFNPLLERGARGLGISGAYNTGVLGGNKTQMLESGLTDALNTAIHPVSTSPTTRAAFEAVTGNEMSLKGLRDDEGKSSAQFWPLQIPKGSGIGRKAFEGALDLNPAVGSILHSFGVNRDPKDVNKLTPSEGNMLLQTLVNIGLPRLVKKSDTGKKYGFIQKQQKAMNRNSK